MLLSVFGTPSPLTYWILHAVKMIAQALDPGYGFVQAIKADEFESLFNAIPQRPGAYVVFFSDCPFADLSSRFLSFGTPLLCVADDPEDLVSYLATVRNLRGEYALRYSSQYMCSLAAVFGAKNSLLVRKEYYSMSVYECVRRIYEHYGVILDTEQYRTVLLNLDAEGLGDPAALVGNQVTRIIPHASLPGQYCKLDTHAKAFAVRVASQYEPVLQGKRLEYVVWPRELLLDTDQPGRPATKAKDMMGRARILLNGPYMHLPAGIWNARVELEIDKNFSGNLLFVDVVEDCMRTLSGIKAPLPKQGVFQCDVPFEVSESAFPIEIRFSILQGAIEGEIYLRMLTITRLDTVTSP